MRQLGTRREVDKGGQRDVEQSRSWRRLYTPNATATARPIPTAIIVARALPSQPLSAALRTRPPSIGNAGIRLKRARARFATINSSMKPGNNPRSLNPRNDSPAKARTIATFTAGPARAISGASRPRQPSKPSDPADGIQAYILGLDVELTRHERVPELVEENAAEKGQDKQNRVQTPVEHPGERQNEQEGRMDKDINPRHPAEFP